MLVNNEIGAIQDIAPISRLVKAHGAYLHCDAAQAPMAMGISGLAEAADFLSLSGHKMYGPTGIGVLWGRESLLDRMMPYQGGGEMISQVTLEAAEYAILPQKFEAGTPNIAGAIGLGAAIDYLLSLDMALVSDYERHLLEYATQAIKTIPGINLIGTAAHKAAVLSFIHGTVHAHDIGTVLNSMGIAIRSGHHCAMPLMQFFDVAATTRASFAFYNTREEVDRFIDALVTVREVFG